MSAPLRLVLATPLLALLCGCQTVEVVKGVEYPVEDGPREDKRETAILEALEDDPDNLSAWYALGNHYESLLRFADAYRAYGEFYGRVDRDEKKRTIPLEKRSTEGLFCLSRCARKLGRMDLAMGYSLEILNRQPKTLKQAKLNPHFRVAHLLVAQVYLGQEKDEKAYLHAMIHRELDGRDADGILLELEERKQERARRERAKPGSKETVEPSQEKGSSESAPAGSRK